MHRWRYLLNPRFAYATTAGLVLVLGLASRQYRAQLPTFVADYAGDTLWALLLFLMVSCLLLGRTLATRAALSLVLAASVEVSQLYHAPWIDAIRQTRLGGWVLGFGFLWSDLACYAVGIATGAVAELGLSRLLDSTPSPGKRTTPDQP
jgi:hypothetical protein